MTIDAGTLALLCWLGGMGFGLAIGAIGALLVYRRDLLRRTRLEVTGQEAPPAPTGQRAVVPAVEDRVRQEWAEASIARGTEELLAIARRNGTPLDPSEARERAKAIYYDLEGGGPTQS